MTSNGGRGARGKAPLARKAHELALREDLFPAGSRVLVMVSGGQDSLALLDIICGLLGRSGGPVAVHALHINHHLRGNESDDDQALVIRACGERGVSLTVAHRPVAKAGGNVQERARQARREAALEAAAEQRCDRIALGHTADDQAETMLYRLGRYGGLAAFRAMPPCDPPWVRPLLEARRAETGSYCREHGIEFAVDRGNAYPGYARTGLRQEVLPAWEAAHARRRGGGRPCGACGGGDGTAGRGSAEGGGAPSGRARGRGSAGMGRVRGRRSGGPVHRAAFGAACLTVHCAARGTCGCRIECLRASRAGCPLRRLFLHRWLEGCAGPAATRASVLALEALLQVRGSARAEPGRGLARASRRMTKCLYSGARRRRSRSPRPAPVPLTVPGRAVWGNVWVAAEPVERFLAPDVSREAFVDARCLDGTLAGAGSPAR